MDASIAALMTFCHADRTFFEPPWRIADQASLFLTDRPLPEGWQRTAEGLWTVLRPPGVALPEQGWKLHVSATDADAKTVCGLVTDFCFDHGLAFKHIRSGAAMRLLNSKYADRSSSGKLLTLYPASETQLTEVLAALAQVLRGHTGPYILSDLRYEDSPIYVRYGAFRKITFPGPHGDPVHAIRTPDGDLVEDSRRPEFVVPPWISIPAVLTGSMENRDAGGGDFPYLVERALHFSNGGGVYLARDRQSDGYVVLLEARPHAGLDARGVDAVARLGHQRAILERLDGLHCVPRLLGYLEIWEHHFLVEEYIEGRTLMEEAFDRYPLVAPDPSAADLAAYVQWATEILARVDHALMSIHARGIRFVDLHPANVILRADGSVALVDFEIAADLSDPRPPALAAPGFAAPAGLSGQAADDYVMNCLRQWLFLPISPLQDRDPVKPATLTGVIAEHFPVPQGFPSRMIRGFGLDSLPHKDIPAQMFDTADPDWPAIRDSLVAGINASATPDREDRLFPGDPRQHLSGGHTVAHGAAGVLWALHQVGAEVAQEHVDWLVAAARRAAEARPGLMEGLHGVAAVLETLGRHSDALEILDRARRVQDGVAALDIHNGLSGIGFSLLHFAGVTGDENLHAEALKIGEHLCTQIEDGQSAVHSPDAGVGLLKGLTGIALYLLRLHELTGQARYLDLARLALRQETGRGRALPDGTFQLLEANRYHAYLGTGSIGLALVMSRHPALREEPVIAGARRACASPFIRHPFLFMGRAGTIAALRLLDVAADRPVVDAHIRRLGWHALSYRGHLAFPGNQLLRLSMDLATGSAGILAALGVAFDRNASVIPLLDLRSSVSEEAEGR